MIIKLFEIISDFFDLMYSPFIEDITENDKEKLDEEKELDEEKGLDHEEYKEEICGCNLCDITRKILLFINPTIYKKLNDNKVD
jgi:hypothetical protein